MPERVALGKSMRGAKAKLFPKLHKSVCAQMILFCQQHVGPCGSFLQDCYVLHSYSCTLLQIHNLLGTFDMVSRRGSNAF